MSELEGKNRPRIEQLVASFIATFEKEGWGAAEALKIDLKGVIEGTEIAALWVTDSDDLDAKMELALQCGDGARQFETLRARLVELGTDLATFDPRHGGYSKLFAFLRSLQTTEERAGAGLYTGKALAIARATALATIFEREGDLATARLYGVMLVDDERRHQDAGRRALMRVALNEESQARARRASYRLLELAGEVWDPGALRKTVGKKTVRAP